jgi:hypothetical protein
MTCERGLYLLGAVVLIFNQSIDRIQRWIPRAARLGENFLSQNLIFDSVCGVKESRAVTTRA